MALADKERADHSEQAEILSIMGDVRDRTALLVDDFVISGGTLAHAAACSSTEAPSRSGGTMLGVQL